MSSAIFARQTLSLRQASRFPPSRRFCHGPRQLLERRQQQQQQLVRPRTHIRGAKTYSRPPGKLEQMVIDARTKHPVLFPTLLIATIASVSMLTMMAYDQYKRQTSHTTSFPAPVEERLRLALHYTHISPDPETATGYFLEAIKVGEEVGMDPYGKDFVGMRVRFSEMLEQFGHVKAALEVLDGITKDFEHRLSEIDQMVVNPDEAAAEDSQQRRETRRDIVKFIVQAKVKESDLYQGVYMQDPAMAKKTLSDAVDLIVKETQDPLTNSFTDDNGAGLTTGEIASILSQMADLYATTGEEANAVQVYLLALEPLRAACNGSRSCKEVQVFSNIAATMGVALKKPNAKINGKPVTKSSAAAARKAILKWADQAIATADLVLPEDRDEICETALLSARLTRADLLYESGDKAKSQEAYAGLLSTVKERNLSDLIQVVEQRLKATSG